MFYVLLSMIYYFAVSAKRRHWPILRGRVAKGTVELDLICILE